MESRYFIVHSNAADRCEVYLKSTGELAAVIIYHRCSEGCSNEQYLNKMLRVMDSYVKQFEG